MFSLDCHGCNVGAKEVVVAKWGSIKRVDNLDNLGGQPGTAVRDTIKVHYRLDTKIHKNQQKFNKIVYNVNPHCCHLCL